MPIPVPLFPASPLGINDGVTARAEQMLSAFVRAIGYGATGGALPTPACTYEDKDAGVIPVLIDTPEKQLFIRHTFLAIASVFGGAVRSEVVGSTSAPTYASGTFTTIPEMNSTLVTNGGNVLVTFSSSFILNAADSFDFSLMVDGVEIPAARRHVQSATAIAALPGSTQALVPLSGGSHVFTAVWRAQGGSARAYSTNRSMTVVEV